MLLKNRISLKTAAIIGVVQLFATTALFLVIDHFLTKVLEQKSVEDMNIIAKDRAELVETYIKGCCDFLDIFSKNQDVINVLKNPGDKKLCGKMTEEIHSYTKMNSHIEGLYVAKWDTYVLAHNNPDSCNISFRNAEKAKELELNIRSKGRAFCSGIILAPITKKLVIPVYAPIYDESGQAIGFAGAAFHTHELAEKLNTLAGKNTSYTLINASNNIYIFDEDFDKVGTVCETQSLLNAVETLKSFKDHDAWLSYTTNKYVVSCYFMSFRNWVFAVASEKASVFALVHTVRNSISVICVFIALIMFFITTGSVNFQMRPIRIINEQLGRLKKSDYTRDPNISKLSRNHDEFGSIAMSLEELHSVLEDQYELFHEIFEAQTVGTLVTNSEDSQILLINKMALKLYGIDPKERNKIKLSDIQELFDEVETEKIKKVRELSKISKEEVVYETSLTHQDGKKIFLLSHAKSAKLLNGETVIIFSFVDITTRKKLEENLVTLSETDSLTSIFNRRSGEYKVKKSIIEGKHGMFCLFDVNKFKYVNDTFGHAAGDRVLVEIAKNMRRSFRTSDILIRLGGDEFVIFAPEIESKYVGAIVLDRFMSNIAEIDIPALNGHKISISLGAVIVTANEEFSQLYTKADSLMYDCKNKGGNAYKFYNEEDSTKYSGSNPDL